jgi:RNA polymerase sigma-70 factor (ECF subfamily)
MASPTPELEVKVDTVRAEHEPQPIDDPGQLEGLSDERLTALLVVGNHDAMRVIFDRYYPTVMRIALRIVRNHAEAEDVAQIAFTDFYRDAKRFDASRGSLRTWLLQYAYGRSINRLQSLKSRRHSQHVELTDVNPMELATENKTVLRLTNVEARFYVVQVLAALDEKYRRVIELVCYCGLTIPEVAAMTGESVGNVQHHYYRGIEKLRITFRKAKGETAPEMKDGKTTGIMGRLRKAAAQVAKEVASVKAQLQ